MTPDRVAKEVSIEAAREQDSRDALSWTRERFALPGALRAPDGRECAYFAGNSLGVMPRAAQEAVAQELRDWERLAVEAHFEGARPWVDAHEFVREPLARLVGAKAHEVVAMNSLTVNLHLLMTSFYRPTKARWRILMERGAFPSDAHAVASQLHAHGFDPAEGIVWAAPESGDLLGIEVFERALEAHGDEIALAVIGGVHYATGELFDLARVVELCRSRGIVAGLDLAHAAGNIPLRLHEWGADFAVWCSYKYLNSGPGAVAGAFVHERHTARGFEGPRFQGWWGHEAETRFKMATSFTPAAGADAWQLSNPPILALAPVRASLELFDEVGMAALREKSIALTGFLERAIEARAGGRWAIVTPREAARRGSQLSVRVSMAPREVVARLRAQGVIADAREPDIVRLAPAALYTSFEDCARAGEALAGALSVD